ncbi:MAG: cytochrome c [Verrucomicrobia bacterium]|nr:cytochrome c [Verrucomicrobiota bacterium]
MLKCLTCLWFLASLAWTVHTAERPLAETGLKVTFQSLAGDTTSANDVIALSNVALYVPAGTPPTPFMPPGNFSAIWSGAVAVDLRTEFSFQAELNGELKLEINGQPVLEGAGTGDAPLASKPVRLNKGANTLTATFRSPAKGDAFLRLAWTNRETPLGPIPLNALTHTNSPELEKANQLRLGRELLAEFRCLKCHVDAASGGAMPELAMDAPLFDDIGARRNFAWMGKWILDPRAQRTSAHMPKIFHGANAKADAEAAAAFLATLKTGSVAATENAQPTSEQREAGQKLFDTLHCVACHNAPDAKTADEKKISLQQVREKFALGTLAAFLLKPDAHFTWTRMPRFKLTEEEAAQLVAFLNANATKRPESTAPTDGALVERGKKLVATSGCLNCHSLKLENQFPKKALAELTPEKWTHGCVAAKLDENSKSPEFTFTEGERAALQAFAATDRAALRRHVPAEFAERQTRLLNCRECHGKFEGFPGLDVLGGKLKSEWTQKFLAGEVSYKPRPWLDARMPAFPARAEALARGLAMQHGFPPLTAPEPAIDPEAAKVGQKLVSAVGGFTCTSCHAVGAVAATQVFEAPGLNLAYTSERLLKPYFQRWIRSPLSVEPATKMPAYFDEEGRSPLADVYEGDGAKQINALWQYLRQGEKAPPPPLQ